MGRGALIAIEGLDRTGKTTQTSQLVQKLQDLNVQNTLVKFPQRETNIGQLINRYLCDKTFELSDQAAHLLFSANRWELVDEIKGLLESGHMVILDRYVYSGVAYSSAKGLDFEWCLSPDRGLPKPDVTVFLKFKQDVNSQRDGFGAERYEIEEFQQQVKLEFEKFACESNWRPLFVDHKSIKEVEADIWDVLQPYINGVDTPLKSF